MKIFWSCFCIFVLTGCEQYIVNQGYDIETANFNDIIVGKDDVSDVFNKLGSPTTRSSVKQTNGDFCWYYASKHMKKFGFMNPKVVSQKTYVITFDKYNKVKSVQQSTYEKPIHTVSETTKAGGTNRGIVKETFGGMGKYIKRYSK